MIPYNLYWGFATPCIVYARSCFSFVMFTFKATLYILFGDRILGRDPDKSHKSFSSLLFTVTSTACSRFLFLQTHTTSHSSCKGERWKTSYKTIPPSLWFKKSMQKPQVWERSRLRPETSTWLKVHEFGFQSDPELLGLVESGSRGRILGRNWDTSLQSKYLLGIHCHLY